MVKTPPEQELLSPLYEEFLQTRPPGDLHIYIYVPTSHLFVIRTSISQREITEYIHSANTPCSSPSHWEETLESF